MSFYLRKTFVDPSQGYDGDCYKAAGWTEVGLTQGGRGAQERSRKLYFVKELKLGGVSKLPNPNFTPSDTTNPRQSVLFFERLDLESLRKSLDKVPDYRSKKGSYPFVMVGAKTNEIPNARELLDGAELDAQTVVTADALHTQRKTARSIVKKTPITSSQLKTINGTCEQLSLKTPRPRAARYRSVLQSLHTDG